MMHITFQSKTYNSTSFQELAQDHKEYEGLARFIKDWIEGEEIFEFKTSGSTGQAKEIKVYRKQIEASVGGTSKSLHLTSKDCILLCLNPQYIASIMMVARALVLELDLVILKPTSNPLMNLEDDVSFASFVPFQIYQMISDGSLDKLERIHHVLIGGAPLNQEAIQKLHHLTNNIYMTYGMTETVSHIALMKISQNHSRKTFKTLEGVEINVNPENCLMIKGAVTNYVELQTNDQVKMISETEFIWLGRSDNVINSGGIKIHPEELEECISALFSSELYFIGGISDEKLNQRCVLITETLLSEERISEIKESITKGFSKHHVPRNFICCPDFKLTDSGKIKRKAMLHIIDLKYKDINQD